MVAFASLPVAAAEVMKQETLATQEMMVKQNVVVLLAEMVNLCWVPLEEDTEMLALMPD
jgi:hypothetical protein